MDNLILIDGPYIERALRAAGSPRLDYALLAARLASPGAVRRVHYAHCLPLVDAESTPEQEARYAAKSKFFHALRQIPRFDVHEGRLAAVPAGAGEEARYVPKLVASTLAAEMLRVALRFRIKRVVLVGGDEEYLPAVRIVRDEAITVAVCHAPSVYASRELVDLADERLPLTPDRLWSMALPERSPVAPQRTVDLPVQESEWIR